MRYMVIETFRDQDAKAVYRRARDRGRQTPEGLSFIDSWVAADLGRCFQLMEADDLSLLQRWVAAWSDLIGVRGRAGDVGGADRVRRCSTPWTRTSRFAILARLR